MLQIADYNVTKSVAYQHPQLMDVMTGSPPVAREELLYRTGGTESSMKRAI